MAKDGTVRGGPRRGTGPKPKPLSEKIQGGQPARYMPNELPELDLSELEAVDLPEGAALEGADMPKPGEYLSAKQKNGVPLGAAEIYKETWLWLKQRGCENLVNKRLIESFAQAFARHIQCEEAISTYGLLGKHPTTGGVMESPFVKMSMLFQNLCLNLQQDLLRPVWRFPALLRFLFGTLLACLFQPPLSAFGICVGLNSVY